MVRDDEINRLIKYAQGMGLSVRFKPYIKGSNDAAALTTDGTELTIYVSNNTTKIEKVLSLIHEIAHMKGFIDNKRKADPKIEEALDSQDNKKTHRKRILDMETNDAVYWEDIYRDTNCKFDLNKLHLQKHYDIWQYEVYYETGKFPTRKEKGDKWRELKDKYGR